MESLNYLWRHMNGNTSDYLYPALLIEQWWNELIIINSSGGGKAAKDSELFN